ncbi:predicted protein [Uncinocarpus reesii 1704]|uniref:Uncharacterized protein n=1 Tax=Uncinocarpus reesii (strain UAMH 1704) TaxID=336963 RepID=C4JP07_UNCRE|nr:uncharacterized protein UREG_03066 [Uncinocarpus reesii 1704]EEP78221.1 predicted protein [Uncinocarpus reesii 1704]
MPKIKNQNHGFSKKFCLPVRDLETSPVGTSHPASRRRQMDTEVEIMPLRAIIPTFEVAFDKYAFKRATNCREWLRLDRRCPSRRGVLVHSAPKSVNSHVAFAAEKVANINYADSRQRRLLLSRTEFFGPVPEISPSKLVKRRGQIKAGVGHQVTRSLELRLKSKRESQNVFVEMPRKIERRNQ